MRRRTVRGPRTSLVGDIDLLLANTDGTFSILLNLRHLGRLFPAAGIYPIETLSIATRIVVNLQILITANVEAAKLFLFEVVASSKLWSRRVNLPARNLFATCQDLTEPDHSS